MKLQDVINIILLVGIAICIYLLITRKQSNKYGNIVHQYNTYDSSITKVSPVSYNETTKWIKDTIRIPIPANVDTLAILRDYYTKKVSIQEYRDSSLYAKISDTLFLNSIHSRSFEYKILRPTQVVEVLPVPKLQLFAGTTISAQLTGIDATALINGKYIIKGGYDLRGKQPYFSAGIKILPLKIK